MDDEARTMVLVQTTLGSREDARRLARRLVESGAACCVHVQEMESVYPWEGRIEDETEFRVEARTPRPLRDSLVAAIAEDHPYDTPLVEVVAETRVNAAYARWAAAATRTGHGD